MDKIKDILDKAIGRSLISCVISGKKNKLDSIDKIKIRQIILKDVYLCQVTEYVGQKVIHHNLDFDATKSYICDALTNKFKQCQLSWENHSGSILVSSKGQVTVREKGSPIKLDDSSLSHNRKKEYLLPEGTVVDFLVDLGVMNNDGHILKPKYDKYKQINRFLEFIRDIIPSLDKTHKLTILDFGCGKSYLTFALYHCLKIINGFNIQVIGLDLKKDVIEKCNNLAEKYGYTDLHFLAGDVADYNSHEKIDMVVTLHACDTATDYALAKAVFWDADVILSVPCCQHEFNKTIKNNLLAPVFKYGIIKERSAALLTDGLRACLLEACGYDTQILEFIDMEHTPKNLLIRAVKNQKNISTVCAADYEDILRQYNVNSTLYTLLKEGGKLN